MTYKIKLIASALTASMMFAACSGASSSDSAVQVPEAAAQAATEVATEVAAAATESMTIMQAKFSDSGAVSMPENWREWIYVGTPLTPNALNGGAAPFPEFHNVYVEPTAFKHFAKTGKWAEGTQIVKELVNVRDNDNDPETGASSEVSGVGYMMGEFSGLELSVKDNTRYADQPGGWAYFSFGHQPQPYNASAEAFPADACNFCHEASADNDFVFSQFYPVIRAVDGK